jgi:uncharacterized protein (TIGR02996 family)
MVQQEAFLQAILEHPEDDTPRLVYADWLEDHGDPTRAEFIRLQIELAHLAADAPERAALVEREQALLREHGRRWAEPLRGLVDGWRFERGFIEGVQVWSFHGEIVENLARALALAPVWLLSIFDQMPDGDALVAAAPLMARLRGLQIDYTSFYRLSEPVQTLLTSPHVAGLTSLSVVGDRNGTWLTRKALRAIITSPSLTGLTQLTLLHDWDGLENDLICTLARSPRKAKLEKLNLSDSEIDPDTMRELGHSRHLTRLTELDLSCCPMERASWEALLEARGSAT